RQAWTATATAAAAAAHGPAQPVTNAEEGCADKGSLREWSVTRILSRETLGKAAAQLATPGLGTRDSGLSEVVMPSSTASGCTVGGGRNPTKLIEHGSSFPIKHLPETKIITLVSPTSVLPT
ncbi:hypothetical protein E4U54_003059, partial [Claviceps lovelessii]